MPVAWHRVQMPWSVLPARVTLLRSGTVLHAPVGGSAERPPPVIILGPLGRGLAAHDSYLVDSASSHMLVSKIKPCMSKYKQLYSETANGSLNQL
jgi:hypothetical protein